MILIFGIWDILLLGLGRFLVGLVLFEQYYGSNVIRIIIGNPFSERLLKELYTLCGNININCYSIKGCDIM